MAASLSGDKRPGPDRPARGFPSSVLGGKAGLALAVILCGLIAAYSLWYTSSGQFPSFPAIQNDYVDLGNAFLHGQVSLLEQPDPRLATLPNPYEYKQRRQIPYHWDASYYAGKYYLYWGPVPALISAALEAIFRGPPSASVLVVLPYILLLGVFLVLLVCLSRLFPDAGTSSSLWLFLLMGFFNLPLLFLIGQPRHYQASIIYGQLFLLCGLLGFVLYTTARKPAWLLLSSLGWGLAFACRYNLAISAGIYLAFAVVWMIRDSGRDRFWLRAVCLMGPLAACLLGLGFYNFGRFANPLETGLAYQLTIPEFFQITYSVSYIPSNLYLYLVYPLTGSSTFPFIQSAHFRAAFLPDWLRIPPHGQVDQVVFGIFPTAPVVWLSILALPLLLIVIRESGKRRAITSDVFQRNFLFCMIACAAAGQFLFLLVFFYTAERYIADFYLPLILCLAMIVWRLDEALRSAGALRLGLWLTVGLLALWTGGIAYFGCFGVPTLVSNFYDPRMLAGLASFWNAQYAGLRALWTDATRPILGLLNLH
jgi:hypothetical protein